MLAYQDLLDIGLSPDAETLQERLVAAAGKLGFGLAGGTLIRGRLASGRALVHGFGNPPDGFEATMRSIDLGLRDPLLTAMLSKEGCYTYDSAFYAKAGAGDLYEILDSFGYRNGMAISIHEHSHMEMFSFGVDGPDALPSSQSARLELEGALRVLALYAQEAAKQLFTPPATLDPGQTAKPELETLRWAADAKVVWKRGDVTVISNPGRSDRRGSAARKIGAATGPQAILRAIKGGLIDP
jgi:hypothetical protein